MTTNIATDLQVSYSPQTFDIEHEQVLNLSLTLLIKIN